MYFIKMTIKHALSYITTQCVGGTCPSQSPEVKEAPVVMMLGKLQMWKYIFPLSFKSPCPTNTNNCPALMECHGSTVLHQRVKFSFN